MVSTTRSVPRRHPLPASAASWAQRSGEVVAQRDGLLDDLGGGAVRAARLASAIALDPSALPRLLAEGLWAELTVGQKKQVVDKVLVSAKWLVENGPLNLAGSLSFLARLVQEGIIGFLDRAIGYDPDFKVALADRLLKLLAHPSPEFSIGYLIGFVKGVWDGVTGPFVLVWDLIKFQGKIVELEARLVAALANKDRRRQLVEQTQVVMAKVEAAVGPALAEVMSGRSDPAAILRLFDRLISSVLGESRKIGASVADALVRFLQQPDRQLGEGVGWVSGTVVFELLLLALTEGGYTAVKEAVTGVKWIAEAFEAAARLGGRVEAALGPLFAALARFKTMLTSYKGLAGVVEVIEEIFNLFLKYLKVSYGLAGPGERGAAKVEEAAGAGERGATRALGEAEGAGVKLERSFVNTLGEPHEIKILLDGRVMRCSLVCETIAENLARRATKLPPEMQAEALDLVKRAKFEQSKSVRSAASGLDDAQRMKNLEENATKSVELEQKMSALEQKAGVGGARPAGPFNRTAQEVDDLARDPAHGFQLTPKGRAEAQIGLDLEARGALQGPIRRDATGGAEFIDINGKAWDVKGPHSGSSYVQADELAKVQSGINNNEGIILDTSGLNPTDAKNLRDAVAKEPAMAGKVILYP